MEVPTRLTEKEARKYIPATKDKLKRLRQDRSIKFYRIGHRSLVYDRASIDAYLENVSVENLRMPAKNRKQDLDEVRDRIEVMP
jgi:hypothetical protein